MSRITQIRLLLLLAIVVVFGRSLINDFVDWDDGGLIFRNANISNPTFHNLLHHWNPSNKDNLEMYDPLVYTTWWSIAQVAQLETADMLGAKLNPAIYHAANLVVHWLSVCVVFEILRRLKFSNWPAMAGALIFALHPIQTECVVWATAMKDLLSGLFALLAIWIYIVALESTGKSRKWNYILATVLFAGALLAKPSTVVVPAMAAVIDRFIYRRSWRDIGKWIWPWMAMALIITAIAVIVQPPHTLEAGPPWARPLIAMDSLAFYFYKLILPINLSYDYGRNPTSVLTDPALHHPLYWTWIFPTALAVILWRLKRPLLTVAGLIFLLGVLPVLGLKAFVFQYYSTVADRYVYCSMLGAAIVVAWWMSTHRRRMEIILFFVVATVLGSLSFVQAGRWHDSETLFKYGISLNRTMPIRYGVLGQYEERVAVQYIQRAKQTPDPEEQKEFLDQANTYLLRAMDDYRTLIRLEPTSTHGYDRLAYILVTLNRLPEAIALTEKWMEIDPQAPPDAQEKPGVLPDMLGSLYLKNHQYSKAVNVLKQSLKLRPDPDVEKKLGVAEQILAESATRPTTSPTAP